MVTLLPAGKRFTTGGSAAELGAGGAAGAAGAGGSTATVSTTGAAAVALDGEVEGPIGGQW